MSHQLLNNKTFNYYVVEAKL